MFKFKNRKISRDDFRAQSKKRFNFLHNIIPSDKKQDLDHEKFITGEKLPKKWVQTVIN